MAGEAHVFFADMDSPIGPLTIVKGEQELYKIEFGRIAQTLPSLQNWMKKVFPERACAQDNEQIAPVAAQLREYFRGDRFQFSLPLVFQGTTFQKQVWQALRQIPYGETRTYKDIAEAIGSPKAIRAVGNANNKNPLSIVVPCHRVIGANGSLTGYGGGLDKKQYLLQFEKDHQSTKSVSTPSASPQ